MKDLSRMCVALEVTTIPLKEKCRGRAQRFKQWIIVDYGLTLH